MSARATDPNLKVNSSLDVLAPKFRDAVNAALTECNDRNNLQVRVFETYRSQQLQALYYARGRTIFPPAHTVTNAPTNLHSWHGFGLAVDVVHAEAFWNPPEGEAWFTRVAAIFKTHRCKWGGDWKNRDLPHLQWGECKASPSDEARTLLATDGLKAVWEKAAAT